MMCLEENQWLAYRDSIIDAIHAAFSNVKATLLFKSSEIGDLVQSQGASMKSETLIDSSA